MCCRSLIKACTAINRIFNLILSLVGLAALSYGIFILSKTDWVLSIFPLSVTSWGSLLFLCTLTYATCGYKSSCCGGCYVLLMLVFFLVNAIGVIFYFTHETEAIQYLNQTLVDVPVSCFNNSFDESFWFFDQIHTVAQSISNKDFLLFPNIMSISFFLTDSSFWHVKLLLFFFLFLSSFFFFKN